MIDLCTTLFKVTCSLKDTVFVGISKDELLGTLWCRDMVFSFFLVDNVIDLYTTFLCNSLGIKFCGFSVMYSIEGIVAVVISKDELLGTSWC